MQIINSYSTAGAIKSRQQFRLFHMARPSIRQWRQTRFGHQYQLDPIDQWIVDNINLRQITTVDFAGWYLEQFGFTTTCIESDPLALQYWPNCCIESDLLYTVPDYVSDTNPIVFKHPGFARYITVEQFVKFLIVWTRSLTVLNFNKRFILHNYLKYDLLDLVRERTDLKIQQVYKDLWISRL